MSRSKYRINADDVNHAADYLTSRLQSFALELGDVSTKTAKKGFDEAVAVRSKNMRADLLNAWCEEYLNDKEWAKLKMAIRKRRERKSRAGEIESVTISTKAFVLLRKLANRDNVTYSKTLEKYLGRTWRA